MFLEYPNVIILIATFLALIVANHIYFRVALHAGIIDTPNSRSSHQLPTIRGGGIVFVVALLFWASFRFQLYSWFILGALLIALVSLIDDVRSLPTSLRFLVHLIGVIFLGIQVDLFAQPAWIVLPVMVVAIGAINAFNFMDGINGITGIYGLVNILTFYFINREIVQFTDATLLQYVLLSLLVFLFYNFRSRAVCFAGDVGSMTLAFIQIFLVLQLIFSTQQFAWVFLFLVFGVDSVITIVYRLRNGENIFTPHRSHLYQYFSNELRLSHLRVSTGYGLLQLGINIMLILLLPSASVGLVFLIAVLFTVWYVVVREYVLTRLGMKGLLGNFTLT